MPVMMSDATVVLTGADGIGIACAWSGGSCMCGCNYSFRGGAPLPVPVVAGFCSRGAAAVPGWLAGWRCTRVRYVDLREN